jgi:mannose/fructose/N-acetylgalactosamine-specific phosphotransferase system component IIC
VRWWFSPFFLSGFLLFLLVGDISCEQGVLGGTVEMIFIGNGRRFRFNKGL